MFGLDSVLVAGAFKLFLGITGIILARITLMWMDSYIENSNSKFAVWLARSSDMSQAIYRGSRFIAIAIIIGSAIG